MHFSGESASTKFLRVISDSKQLRTIFTRNLGKEKRILLNTAVYRYNYITINLISEW